MCIKKGIKMNCIKKAAYVFVLLFMTTGAAWGMDIFEAARKGNIGRIEELLANGAGVNQRDNFGFTALHFAAGYGHEAVVTRLIELGAGVNQANKFGFTALHCAAMNGHENTIRVLIEADADINQQDNRGETALHSAARNGHENAIRGLIEAGADMNQTTYKGKTAVDLATAFNQPTTVALLNDYIQRMEQARQRVPVIAHTLALATHSAASPLALLPQELIRHIARLVVQAEAVDARRPRQANGAAL